MKKAGKKLKTKISAKTKIKVSFDKILFHLRCEIKAPRSRRSMITERARNAPIATNKFLSIVVNPRKKDEKNE